jgi:hypothetical protein
MANSFVYATGPQTLGSGEIDARVTLDLNAGDHTVTISILNLEDNPRSAGQLISGVLFTMGGLAGHSSSPTLVDSSYSEIRIDSMGRPTAAQPELSNTWTVATVSGSTFTLCDVCANGGHPQELVIGGPASSGRYSNANASIAGSGTHNPFILGSGDSGSATPQWTVKLSDLQVQSAVTRVSVMFGTTYGEWVDASPRDVETPEPGTLVLLAVGIVGLVLCKRSAGREGPRHH